jgi:N-formylglutamate amidohydrolase
MILHIPHSAIEIPNPSAYFGLTDNDINLLTDWFTDELFCHPRAEKVVFPYSRLWCDVERFRDDHEEPMFGKGMGVVYTHGATGNPIRKVTAADTEQIKKDYYDPHHAKFNAVTARCLGSAGRVFVVDCHSFPGTRLVHEFSDNRPDFCLGTDAFHTPKALVDDLQSYLQNRGFTTLINDPYAGTIVPSRYLKENNNVKSIMVEVNRDLYLESPGVKNNHFNNLKSVIYDVLDMIDQHDSL